MTSNKDYTFYIAFLASMRTYLSISNESLDDIMIKYSLPTEVMHKLRSSVLCHFQLNRMCNLLEYIISPQRLESVQDFESFDPLNILTEMSTTFSKTVSGYIPLTTNCYSKLRRPVPIQVNKAKFELVFLNLLYCSLRSADNSRSKDTKLTFYITENKDSFVFHLRDNCRTINSQIVERVFSDSPVSTTLDNTIDSVIALSLEAALKAACELEGSIAYKPLKSGNRYDISLPKSASGKPSLAKSISLYTPTYSYYDQIFADILLEKHINKNLNGVDTP